MENLKNAGGPFHSVYWSIEKELVSDHRSGFIPGKRFSKKKSTINDIVEFAETGVIAPSDAQQITIVPLAPSISFLPESKYLLIHEHELGDTTSLVYEHDDVALRTFAPDNQPAGDAVIKVFTTSGVVICETPKIHYGRNTRDVKGP